MKFIQFSLIFLLITVSLAFNNRNGRIAGGNDAIRGQFPYHVKLEAFDGRSTRLCGGALIKNQWVLTAAHCISTSVDIIIRLGMVDRFEGLASGVFRITDRKYIKIHPEYDADSFANDLAILYLSGGETTTEDEYVDVIALPPIGDEVYDFTGQNGTVAGFGLLNDNDPPLLSLFLQYATMPIIGEAACQQVHGNSIHPADKLCTDTTGGISTCIGDEGGPLVVQTDEGYLLAGIGSAPISPCTSGFPAIFTSLLPHRDWIDDTVAADPDVPVQPPPHPDKCNCVCNCYTCPALPYEPEAKAKTSGTENFWKR